MRTARSIDELTRDAHLAPGFAYAAFKHVTYSQLATDLLHVHGSALVDEARIACDNEQTGKAGQRRDDLLHDPIRKVLLLRVTAQIWKDRTAMEGAHATPANGRSRGSIAGWPHLDVPPAARTEIPRRRAGPC